LRLSFRPVRNWVKTNRQDGKLRVIKAVWFFAFLQVLGMALVFAKLGITLRENFGHPLEATLRLSLALMIPIAFALTWPRAMSNTRVARLYDWFGAALFAISFCLLMSNVDEYFELGDLARWLKLMLSDSWMTWATAGILILIRGASTLSVELNSERKERLRLESLMAFTRHLINLDYQPTLDMAVGELQKLLKTDACVLYLWAESDQALVPVAGCHSPGYPRDYVSEVMVFKCPLGFGLTGMAMQTGESYHLGNTLADKRSQAVPGFGNLKTSGIVVPIQVEGRRLGVVRLARHGINQFSTDDLTLVQSYAAQTALVIERSQIIKHLSDMSGVHPLTGLHGAEQAQWMLRMELDRMRRIGHPLSLLMVDVGSPGEMQAILGSREGEMHARRIVQVLQEQIDPMGFVFSGTAEGRMIILLAHVGAEEALLEAARLRGLVDAAHKTAGWRRQVYIGVATWPLDDPDLWLVAEQAVQADQGLHDGGVQAFGEGAVR
jgi:GGDEF domain-containing protein